VKFPEAFYVSGSKVEPCRESRDEALDDPRGLLLMWEPPNPKLTYIMGMDTAEGITGWTRAIRTDNQKKTDNGAIEIFAVDALEEKLWTTDLKGRRVPEIDPTTDRQKIHYRDVQVAEYFAPCDAVEIARVANTLGRIYAGKDEDQCQLIWEAWPGCGMMATQELLRLGYGNLWHWEYITDVAEETNRLGWWSSRESMKLLWYRARRHLMQSNALIRSKWLKSEYANAEIDLDKMRARAAYGYHDDLFMAANLCFWGGHKWDMNPERTSDIVTSVPHIDYQRYAPVLGESIPSFQDWRSTVTDFWDES